MDVTLLVAIVGAVGSFSAILLSIRSKPYEMLKMADERLTRLEERITKLEEENELLRDWAERLVAQVKSLGAEPVKMKPKKGQ